MADSINITVNVEQAREYVEEKRSALVDMIAERVDYVNQMMTDRVKGNLSGAVLQKQTGNLLGTVMQEPAQISGNVITAAVTAGGDAAPYGVYFEEGGTGYYEIRPKNARALAFMMGGSLTFAKAVNHPPTPKLPWFAPEKETAIEEMKKELNDVFAEVLKQ